MPPKIHENAARLSAGILTSSVVSGFALTVRHRSAPAHRHSEYLASEFRLCIDFPGKFPMISREILPHARESVMSVQHETEYCKASNKHKIWYVETHLVEHCNINCKYCDHFSCIASPQFADLGVFEKDLKRIKELSSGMERLRLLGGEPLLHPGITDFFDVARRIFPDIVIDIITNGLLLPRMNPAFFEAIIKHRVAVAVSPYFPPEHKLYRAINEAYNRHGVPEELRLFMGSCYNKMFAFIALDRSGAQDNNASFTKCWHSAFRIFLAEGKIYPCPIAPNIVHFNKQFKETSTFQLTERDCIDIYAAKSEAEIIAFLSKPIDFCRFCDMNRRTDPLYTYSPTKKDASEWVCE
jgi:MoaA/NifB/PqqE/SkfB family radical SAM enzyme